jgi:hypothetical protein
MGVPIRVRDTLPDRPSPFGTSLALMNVNLKSPARSQANNINYVINFGEYRQTSKLVLQRPGHYPPFRKKYQKVVRIFELTQDCPFSPKKRHTIVLISQYSQNPNFNSAQETKPM